MIFYFLLIMGTVFVLVFNVTRAHGASPGALLWKILASLMFVMLALYAMARGGSAANLEFKCFIVVGLVMGLLGDIVLDLRLIYREHDSIYLYSGFGFFLVGHLFFIAAYMGRIFPGCQVLSAVNVALLLVVSVLVALVMALGEKLLGVQYGAFKPVVFMYAAVLTFFMAIAVAYRLGMGNESASIPGPLLSLGNIVGLSLDSAESATGFTMIAVGSVFFLISDFILCGTYFGKGKEGPVYIVSNHVTYYIAQYLIASALLFI
ncbi:MAG: lysoplasmalogenase [Eubacterium sp.]|nr:lysoplasmalogenase [Eubacterium sp.]